ncbi:ABC transporter ATP-binding protein [Anoxynatronum buryatiense]|uniref:Nickel transport system ATP-binding protein n=1 Tax=Anoxynatronum buryatiense TaxID=489973 RepID=A0AA45WX25_9CLOT|nr:dipeptide/oligopeptide/nickel ABC transporter ATP-binding protein [Anoxynatronum buryatiense]SMP61588.1 nickel transport system ATP-binding protein [Anoxynatronum buryatiense]
MLLRADQVSKSYRKPGRWLKPEQTTVLKGVSLTIQQGECVGLVGESGSGKSTLGRLLMGIEKPDSGTVYFRNHLVNSTGYQQVRQQMSVVFQDYGTSVNRRYRVKSILEEPLKIANKMASKDFQSHNIRLLETVGLSEKFMDRYPHELSGGQLQRVCIARAIANQPDLVILDEAISSLDVTIQLQILDLLVKLRKEMKLSYFFITHDLLAVTYLCDRVLFMKEGEIIEEVGDMKALDQVAHPYARTLLEAAMKVTGVTWNNHIQKIS